MTTVFLRLVLVYFVTILSVRLMGKRQIGELQMSELVTAFFLSELATYPVTDSRVPLSYGIIPVVSLICIEVILSYLITKCAPIKRLFDNTPSLLIARGKIRQKELLKNRLTLDELLSQLRLKNIADPSHVDYALLEPNGQISVLTKAAFSPPTRSELNLEAKDSGVSFPLLDDGKLNQDAMRAVGRDKAFLAARLREAGLREKDVFLLAVNDRGEIVLVKKEKS